MTIRRDTREAIVRARNRAKNQVRNRVKNLAKSLEKNRGKRKPLTPSSDLRSGSFIG